MNVRLDTSFESWGGFSETISGSPFIHGRLQYDPEIGIKLELVENPKGLQSLNLTNASSFPVLFGQLVDGTLVTLFKCLITRTEIQIGVGVGSPTIVIPSIALFGCHINNLDELLIKKYIVELSLLDNWSCLSPIKIKNVFNFQRSLGFDVNYRTPNPIVVNLPNRDFDIQIVNSVRWRDQGFKLTVEKHSAFEIIAHENMSYEASSEISWQCINLFSLLISKQLSIKAIIIFPKDISSDNIYSNQLELIYHRSEKNDQKTIFPIEMLLPYNLIKNEFTGIVDKWFSRSEQSVLATNVFFSTENSLTPSVNVKFLSMTQAIESYHRSLGVGYYMESEEYAKALKELVTHIPDSIKGDHRKSLKKRLQYGNEHSLRKRLTEMISRIPKNVAVKITGDTKKFISKIADTRNYYTHYDYSSQKKAFEPKDAYTAAERLRILIVANLLHDLGIEDENLLNVLNRNQDFLFWMATCLPL